MLSKIIKSIKNRFKSSTKVTIKVKKQPKKLFKVNSAITLVCVERLRIKNKYETNQEVSERLAKLDLDEFIKIGKSDLPYTESELSVLDPKDKSKRLRYEKKCIFSFNPDRTLNKENRDLLTRTFEVEVEEGM